MSPRNSFVRGIVLAALLAAAWLPWAVLAGPVLGVRSALPLYLAGATAAYVATLTPRRGRRAAAALLIFVAAGAVALLAPSTAVLAVGLALVIAIGRSLLHPAPPARLIVRETLLLVSGLLFARLLAGPSLVPIALALWGFFLVQSLFFLGGGRAARDHTEGDAFAEAHRRALSLLERPG